MKGDDITMCIKKNTFLIVMLMCITCSPGLSLAEDTEDKTILVKEFSRDHTRATTLRKSKDLNGLASLVKEIQSKWSQKDKQMYGALMVHSLRSWRSAYKRADKKAPINLIRQYTVQVLSTYDPNKPDNISVETEFDLVSILHEEYTYSKGKRTDQDWASARRKGAERWFHVWQRLEKAIDKNWDPNDIAEINVPLPPGAAGEAGMSPKYIKDPVLRAKYEAAIEKNREKIRIRNEQLKLRNIRKRYFRIVEKYLVSTYSIPPFNIEDLKQYLDKYIADDKTRARILDAVKKNTEKQEYKQERARIKALRKSFKPGPVNNLKEYEKFADEIQRKWSRRNKEYYARLMLEVCGPLSSGNFKHDRQYELARQYALLALDKSYGLEQNNRIPIEVEFRLLMYVRQSALASTKYLQSLGQKDDWPNQRREEAKFYFRTWDRLERAIDPNWDPNDPSLVFPRPPVGVDRFAIGMSPENIKDPNLRAEYEAALEEYRQRHKRHSEQRRLRRLKKEDLPILQKHLLRLYSGPLFDSKKLETEALQQNLAKHIKDEKIRAIILDGVKNRLLEESKPKPKAKPGFRERTETRRRSI